MKPLKLCAMVLAASALSLPVQVTAQTTTETGSALQDPAMSAQPGASRTGFDQPLSSDALSGYRGGMAVVHNDMQLAGTTAGNTAINVATGANAISAGAFSNMSGLPIVIQNSGANVLIQNAVILNLQMN